MEASGGETTSAGSARRQRLIGWILILPRRRRSFPRPRVPLLRRRPAHPREPPRRILAGRRGADAGVGAYQPGTLRITTCLDRRDGGRRGGGYRIFPLVDRGRDITQRSPGPSRSHRGGHRRPPPFRRLPRRRQGATPAEPQDRARRGRGGHRSDLDHDRQGNSGRDHQRCHLGAPRRHHHADRRHHHAHSATAPASA